MRLASEPSVRRVVIASKWDMYAYDDPANKESIDAARVFGLLTHDIRTLRRLGKDVVFIAAHPSALEADPELLAAHLRVGTFGTRTPTRFVQSFPLAAFQQRAATGNGWVRRVAAEAGARVIDPADYMCADGSCPTTDGHGKPLRSDSHHLRPFAVARYLTYVRDLVTLDRRYLASTATGHPHP